MALECAHHLAGAAEAQAITARLIEYLMVMTARKRRGDGDELLSPLVMTALPLANALHDHIKTAAAETSGDAEPRTGLNAITANLRAMADLLDSMTPASTGPVSSRSTSDVRARLTGLPPPRRCP